MSLILLNPHRNMYVQKREEGAATAAAAGRHPDKRRLLVLDGGVRSKQIARSRRRRCSAN